MKPHTGTSGCGEPVCAEAGRFPECQCEECVPCQKSGKPIDPHGDDAVEGGDPVGYSCRAFPFGGGPAVGPGRPTAAFPSSPDGRAGRGRPSYGLAAARRKSGRLATSAIGGSDCGVRDDPLQGGLGRVPDVRVFVVQCRADGGNGALRARTYFAEGLGC